MSSKVLLPLSLLIMLLIAPLENARALTRLEESQALLDSLKSGRKQIEARLGELDRQLALDRDHLKDLSEKLQALDQLMLQLEAEGRLLLEQRAAGEAELERIDQDLFATRRDAGLLDNEKLLLLQTIDSLAMKLFPLRHLDELSPLLKSGNLRQQARSGRLAAHLQEPLKHALVELDSLKWVTATRERQLDSLGLMQARQLDRNRESEAALGRNRQASIRRQQELQRDRQRLGELMSESGREQEKARHEVDVYRKAGEEVSQQLSDLKERWQGVTESREAEVQRQQDLARKLGESPAGQEDKSARRTVAKPGPSDSGEALVAGKLAHPVSGRVTRRFGIHKESSTGTELNNPGIDYSCTKGAEVKAVAAGTVERVTWISGFGSTVLLRHAGDAFTVYARLGEVLVQEGSAVKGGQQLGSAGSGEDGQNGALHFELWQAGQARDPLGWIRR